MSSQNMSTYFTTIKVHTAVESRNKKLQCCFKDYYDFQTLKLNRNTQLYCNDKLLDNLEPSTYCLFIPQIFTQLSEIAKV